MKNKITCNVIADLLPLYVDEVLSDDSKKIVEEHLRGCESCRESAEKMGNTIVILKDTDGEKIKKLKKSVSLKKFISVTGLCLITVAILLGGGIFLGDVINSSAGDSLAEIKQFIVISASAMLSLAVTVGWGVYFYYFRNTSKNKNMKRIFVISFSPLLAVYIIFGLGFYLLFYGNAASSDNVYVRTEFQYSDDSYLNQSWVIHFLSENNRPLNVISEQIHNDKSEITGIVFYVREVPIKAMLETNNYTAGYSYGLNGEEPPNDYDFTVKIVYKDKTTVYSMRDEGLFKEQDYVKFAPDTPDTPSENTTIRNAGDDRGTVIYSLDRRY